MIERRKVHRQRVMLGGSAVFPHWHISQDCVVRDLSDDGALLRFERPSLVPDTFDLAIRHKGAARTIRTVWRNGADVGISFHPATDTAVGEEVPLAMVQEDVEQDEPDDPAQQARDRAVLARRIATFVTHRRRPERAPC